MASRAAGLRLEQHGNVSRLVAATKFGVQGTGARRGGGAAVVNAMTGRAAGYVVVPGDLVVRHDG